MANLNFDANQVPPEVRYEAIPAGWYNCQIVGSEMKPTAKGGAYLQLDLQVLDGPYAGRKVFDRLNLKNENPTAVEIAYRRLSAYCHAVGVLQVQDSQQLHGIPLKARITVRTDPSGQYEPSNEVRAVKNINENVGDQAAPTMQQAPAQPWQNQAPAQQAPAQQTPPPAQNQPWNQPQQQQQAPAGPAAQVQGNTPPWLQQAQQANPPAAPQDQGQPTQVPPWAQQS